MQIFLKLGLVEVLDSGTFYMSNIELLIGQSSTEAERLRRLSMITAQHRNREGGCFVTLAMSDGKGEIIRLNILSSGEQQAERIEENFRDRAEEIYCRIIELLDKKPDDKNAKG